MDRAERAETVDECTCRLPSCIAVCTASLTRERCSTPASLSSPTTFFMTAAFAERANPSVLLAACTTFRCYYEIKRNPNQVPRQ